MNTIGKIGYSGTLNGRAIVGRESAARTSAIPVSRKKNQNTGAVNSTIAEKPSFCKAPNRDQRERDAALNQKRDHWHVAVRPAIGS